MTAHTEVRERAASIFIADVTLAHIARQDEDFLRCVEGPGLAPCHDCQSGGAAIPAAPPAWIQQDQ